MMELNYNYTKYVFLSTSRLLISIFALIIKDFLSKNKIVSKAGGKVGERIKKNSFAGVRDDDDFWNLET